MPWRVTIEAMVPQLDDLQRVLGYVDAIDDRAGTTVLGDDLFALPFWNPRFCSAIIRAANSSVPVGTLLAWPSLVTHPHRSTPITNGVKYSLTIWCELQLSLH